jgi:hypothetical protein
MTFLVVVLALMLVLGSLLVMLMVYRGCTLVDFAIQFQIELVAIQLALGRLNSLL